jgi:hypothetical protein
MAIAVLLKAYTGSFVPPMRSFGNVIFVLSHYVLLVCTAQVGGVLFGTVFKVIACLAFAFLLIFVLDRSRYVLGSVIAWVRLFSISALTLFSDRRWEQLWVAASVLPPEPQLSPLFQRPPPPLFK